MLAGIQPFYWSGTGFVPNLPWAFNFGFGVTFNAFVDVVPLSAWAVRDGDIAAVPVPTSLALLGLGLVGLGFSRRKKA